MLQANASKELICAKDSSRIGVTWTPEAGKASRCTVGMQAILQTNEQHEHCGEAGKAETRRPWEGEDRRSSQRAWPVQPLCSVCLKFSPVQSSCPKLWDSIPKPDQAGASYHLHALSDLMSRPLLSKGTCDPIAIMGDTICNHFSEQNEQLSSLSEESLELCRHVTTASASFHQMEGSRCTPSEGCAVPAAGWDCSCDCCRV